MVRSIKNVTTDQSTNSAPGRNDTSKNQCEGQGRKESQMIICREHRYRTCRKGADCTFHHPQKCQKLILYGLKKFDNRGCDPRMCKDLFHPRICFFSMKSKFCKNKFCKNQHLPGTKREHHKDNAHPSRPAPWAMTRSTHFSPTSTMEIYNEDINRSEITFLDQMERRFCAMLREAFREIQGNQR